MDINPRDLQAALRQNLNEIQSQIDVLMHEHGAQWQMVKLPDGSYPASPLVVAKAHALHALALLQSKPQPAVRRPGPGRG